MTFNFHSDGLTYKSESGGQTINNQDISITQNGEYTAESGYTGLGTVSVNVADVPAVITSLSITPSTTAQTITAPTGTDGYSPISVSAVTATIDSNITAENIKDGVEILGVTGNYQGEGGGGFGIPREIAANGYVQYPSTTFEFVLPTNATYITKNTFEYCLFDCQTVTKVDFKSVITVNGTSAFQYAFMNCTGITSIDFSNLEVVMGQTAMSNAFRSCTALTSVSFPKLRALSATDAWNSIFMGCTSLANVSLPALTTLNGSSVLTSAFRQSKLTTLSFPSLTSTSFANYTNQFNSMLTGVTGCTVHFPSNLQSVIGSWSSVTGGFSGSNTSVLFDLPATT